MTTDPQTELSEPDDPSAYALARHIADHPVSTIQAAFQYLNAPLTVELHDPVSSAAAQSAPAETALPAGGRIDPGRKAAAARRAALEAAIWDAGGGDLDQDDVDRFLARVLAALPAAADRAAVLMEASTVADRIADAMGCAEEDWASRARWACASVAAELRRSARLAKQPPETDLAQRIAATRSKDAFVEAAALLSSVGPQLADELPAATCPDPIECGHEAALGQAQQEVKRLGLTVDEYGHGASTLSEKLQEARATNRRLNLRAQKLESELAAYRRAVGQWEVGERGTYISHASLRTIGLACGKDILGSVRHLKHFERVEQAEVAIERVRNYLASQADAFPSNYPVAVPVADVLAALNLPAVVPAGAGEEPADETLTTQELAHAIDNSTPYPVELDSALCRHMAGQLLEMVSVHKRPEHAVWQPEEPPGLSPEPMDPAVLATDEGRLRCPRCREDITDYAEDDHVFRTGDERPYCSGECVVAAHRAEAEQRQSTPCGPVPDECDAEAGELCAVHEREEAHAEGEHGFCGPECDKACTCGSAGDAFVPIGHYADCPQATEPAVGAQQPKEH
jgi:hypothetical protein